MMSQMIKTVLGLGDRNRAAMLDTMLEHFDSKVFELEGLLYPPEDAAARQSFTSSLDDEELWVTRMTWQQRRVVLPLIMRLMREMKKSSSFYEEGFEPDTRDATPELLEELEQLAAEHGATALRYVRLSDDSIFAHKAAPQRGALIYTVRMSKEALDTAPSFEAFLEVARGYHRMAVIGNHLASLLRARGHAAYPGTALGGLTDYTRLAELAGLGTIGYHGLAITPEEGALLRINTVYTSMEGLPLEGNRERVAALAWVRDFCAMCRKCVRSCPVGAIHPEPIRLENGRVQCIETSTCLDYFAANYGCAICADVCPFSQKGYEAIQARFKGNPDAPRFRISALDEPFLLEEAPPS